MEIDLSKIINLPRGQESPDGMVMPKDLAKKNCKKCYGAGTLGTNTITQALKICPCVIKEAENRGWDLTPKKKFTTEPPTLKRPWWMFWIRKGKHEK